MLIFKAATAPPGKAHGQKGTVTYEICHDLPDKWGNHYPQKERCYITVTPTANSNGDLTIDFVNKVFFPAVQVPLTESCNGQMLLCVMLSVATMTKR